MKETYIKIKSYKTGRIIERQLKNLDFIKVSDCMWAKIYVNRFSDSQVILQREY